MRGKNLTCAVSGKNRSGSPPLAREKLLFIFLMNLFHGITTACAGKTPHSSLSTSPSTDHPRLRGKNLRFFRCAQLQRGSPPLAREKRLYHPARHGAPRITPACAGKTFYRFVLRRWFWDHPRLRGKNGTNPRSSNVNPVSPPLAREKRIKRNHQEPRPGITPACAGKTNKQVIVQPKFQDHPRLRGKNVPFSSISVLAAGSPPLAREKPSISPAT